MATKECHEDFAERRKTFIKGLESGFATDGITEKHHHEINRVVLPKACASELHVLLDSIEQTNMGQDLGHRRHFSHPAWVEGCDFGRIWMVIGECVILLVCPPC